MRLEHDTILCEAHGLCTAIDPDRFELDDDDMLIVHKWEVEPSELETVRHAVDSCPRQALSLIDE
ncbi:MAG TPA: ferredoxin [Mycobacteriales bacterium]|nr:ferredoxin [Mycobacteriales bacterium]